MSSYIAMSQLVACRQSMQLMIFIDQQKINTLTICKSKTQSS